MKQLVILSLLVLEALTAPPFGSQGTGGGGGGGGATNFFGQNPQGPGAMNFNPSTQNNSAWPQNGSLGSGVQNPSSQPTIGLNTFTGSNPSPNGLPISNNGIGVGSSRGNPFSTFTGLGSQNGSQPSNSYGSLFGQSPFGTGMQTGMQTGGNPALFGHLGSVGQAIAQGPANLARNFIPGQHIIQPLENTLQNAASRIFGMNKSGPLNGNPGSFGTNLNPYGQQPNLYGSPAGQYTPNLSGVPGQGPLPGLFNGQGIRTPNGVQDMNGQFMGSGGSTGQFGQFGQPGLPQSQNSFLPGQPDFLQGQSSFPQGNGSFPQGNGPFSQGNGPFSQGNGLFPQGNGLFPQGNGAFPNGNTIGMNQSQPSQLQLQQQLLLHQQQQLQSAQNSNGNGMSNFPNGPGQPFNPSMPNTNGSGMPNFPNGQGQPFNPSMPNTNGTGISNFPNAPGQPFNPSMPNTNGTGMSNFSNAPGQPFNPSMPNTNGTGMSNFPNAPGQPFNPSLPNTNGTGMSNFPNAQGPPFNPSMHQPGFPTGQMPFDQNGNSMNPGDMQSLMGNPGAGGFQPQDLNNPSGNLIDLSQ